MAKSNKIEKLSGYELMRRWFDFAFENQDIVCPTHTAMFSWFVELNNRMGWAEKFASPASQTMCAIGLKSYNTYKKIFDDLVKFGFINVISESKNQWSACIIALSNFDKAQYNALDKAVTKHVIKQSERTIQSTYSINKPLNLKTFKPLNTIQPDVANASPDDDEINFSFKKFWDLYDKKVGSLEKIKKKWEKLNPEERQKIIEYIPKYKIAQSDKKFRKNPETFLNNKSWNDELITSNGTTITNTATSIEQRKADRDGMGELARGVLAKIAAEYSA